MVQSRPSMVSTSRRLQALLFLVLSFLLLVPPVSADVSAPNCNVAMHTDRSFLTATDSSLNVTLDPAGLNDDTSFVAVHSNGVGFVLSRQFHRGEAPFTQNFLIDFNTLAQAGAPQTIYLEGAEQHFCQIVLLYDSTTQQVRVGDPGSGNPALSFDLCTQAGTNRSQCDVCMSEGKIWSGLGCIPFLEQGDLVRSLITIGLGITGGVIVLMSLYAGFLLSISQGDPKKVDEAKSAITSVIAGALFVIFSVTILRFIGVNILRLPAFG